VPGIPALADLKSVMLRTPVNEWLDPMKEAPSFEGAFLVSAIPHREGIGAGYLEGMGIGSRSVKVTGRGQRAWLPSRLRGPTHGPSGSFLVTPNLVWNFEI